MGTQGRIGKVAAAALAALILGGGPGLAANRVGTSGPDELVGTHRADTIAGLEGDDALRGLAGDDVYRFGDGWGTDTIVDKARYNVDGQRRPGGTDALDFSLATGPIWATLAPEWGPERNYAMVYGAAGDRVELGGSVVETIVGGSGLGMEDLFGGGQDNTLRPGAGKCDNLGDLGGWPDGLLGRPGLRASDDTYAGFRQVTGTVNVLDWGGEGDVVDLRPLKTTQVSVFATDVDADPGAAESLFIVTGAESEVVLYGQLGDYLRDDGSGALKTFGYKGRIETLVFADRKVSGRDALKVLPKWSGGAGVAAAGERQGPEERARAERLREAVAQLPTPAELAGR